MSRLADRNLLFGILAVQMDFVTRDQLIAGMNAWMMRKRDALGAIFVDQGALSTQRHALLDALVDEHVRQHGDDPQQSLAALSPFAPARTGAGSHESAIHDDLKRIADADVHESLSHLPAAPAASRDADRDDPVATHYSVAVPGAAALRFRILRPHAEGGLGRVSIALDGELNREVALKEIKRQHADDPAGRSRFMLEAEITGGLEHPGIVPVYSLGTYADGRPFYAMRFIRGDSLKEAIGRFYSRTGDQETGRQGEEERGREGDKAAGSASPGLRVSSRLPVSFSSLEFRQLLGRFVDVCNAIAYAHSRGVLHRDLKPGNIMLGKFGETLVVDWGLAKAGVRSQDSGIEGQKAEVGPGSRADSPPHPVSPSSRHPVTPSPRRLVTPSFVEDEPPLQPSSSDNVATLAGVAVGTPAFMSPEQAAGRLDLLGPESDVYSLGATLYQILTGQAPLDNEQLSTTDVLRRVQNGDIPPARHVAGAAVPAALDAVCRKAMALRPADRYHTPRELADDIEHWLADEPVSAWPEPWSIRARRWVGRHRVLVTSAAACLAVAAVALVAGLVLVSNANAELAAANQTIRTKNDALNQSIAAETTARESAQKSEKLAAEQRNLALQTLRLVVDDIDARLKDQPAMQELRQALLSEALEGLKKVARSADTSRALDYETVWVHFKLGDLFLAVAGGGVEQAHRQYQLGHEIALARAQADTADSTAQRDLSIELEKLGDVNLKLGRVRDAQHRYQEGLDIRKKRAAADRADAEAQRDLSIAHDKLGDVSVKLGQPRDAKAHYDAALAIRKQRAQAEPADDEAQRDLSISSNKLGNVSLLLGRPQDARDHYQQALDIARQRAKAKPKDVQAQRDLWVSCNLVGDVQLQLRLAPEAKRLYQEGLDRAKKRADADPRNSEAQRDLSISLSKLGDANLTLGQSLDARTLYLDGLELTRQRVAADPSDSQAQRDLSISLEKVAEVDLLLGRVQSAKGHYQEALGIARARSAADPTDSQAQRDLAISLEKLGDVNFRLGQLAAAKSLYEEGLHVRNQRAAADPTNGEAQRGLAIGLERLGDVTLQMGQPQVARKLYQQGLDIRKKRAAADPDNLEAQRDLALGHFKVGIALVDLPDPAAARRSLTEAATILAAQEKAGLLKETRFASWPKIIAGQLAYCQLMEDVIKDVNVALKKTPADARELLLARAKDLGRREQFDESARTVERLLSLSGPLGEMQFAAARAHGYLAGGQGVRAGGHAEHAVRLLREARIRGYFDLPANRNLLQFGADFDALRPSAEFAKLQTEILADAGRVIFDKKAELRPSDPPDRALPKSPSQVFEVELTAGRRYAIALDAVAVPPANSGQPGKRFDPFLRLEDAAGKELARDDDTGGELNAFLVFIPTVTGRYRVVVTSYDGSAGAYAVVVRERE